MLLQSLPDAGLHLTAVMPIDQGSLNCAIRIARMIRSLASAGSNVSAQKRLRVGTQQAGIERRCKLHCQ